MRDCSLTGGVLPLPFSHFGLAFRRAAQSIRARVKHDAFESAMIEVKSDDIKAFLHALQKTCSAT